MEDLKKQLEEANEAIIEITRGYSGLSKRYHDKYLKPVDERFERFKELMDWVFGGTMSMENKYEKFNELFPKDNGTAGLDQVNDIIILVEGLINGHRDYGRIEAQSSFMVFMGVLEEIKKELES